MSGHYFNSINLWRLVERSGFTASRNLKKLLDTKQALFCKDAPRRWVRGITKSFAVLNDKDESPSLKREPAAPKISKSKIQNMLDHSVSHVVKEDADNFWSETPYPRKFYPSKESMREKYDPKDNSIFLFPGQGSQYVGMGKNLLEYQNVERMYKIASEIVNFDLLNMCLYGPKEELNKTVHCQPAIVVSSLAALEKLREQTPHVVDTCAATAGFSVGEITALIFTGVLSFEDGLKLCRIRAEAMQSASEQTSSGMITVFYGADARLGFACSAAVEWCRREESLEDPECIIANYLYPGCKVIAGHSQALKFIKMNAKDFGIRGIKDLPVSGAFHTRLMEPAAQAVKIALKSMKLNNPVVPVYSNASGKPYFDAEHIRRQLHKQITSPVKWEQEMNALYARKTTENFPSTFEFGPGKSLTAILEKVNGKAWDLCTYVSV